MNSKKDEALRLALEALEELTYVDAGDGAIRSGKQEDADVTDTAGAAISVIREALAQPEQDQEQVSANNEQELLRRALSLLESSDSKDEALRQARALIQALTSTEDRVANAVIQDIDNALIVRGFREELIGDINDLFDHIAKTPSCKGMNCGSTDGWTHSAECQAEHAASVAGGVFVKQPEQEPEAWMLIQKNGKPDDVFLYMETAKMMKEHDGGYLRPLIYADTAPPLREPLTDDELQQIAYQFKSSTTLGDGFYAVARAIEAAHGIKGKV